MTEDSRLESACELMKALGSTTRIQILAGLAGGKEKTVSEIAEQTFFGQILTQSNVSQHLSVMRRIGLVDARKDHPRVFYSLNEEKLSEAKEVLSGLKVAS